MADCIKHNPYICGYLWRITYAVNCIRAEVVECSGIQLYWSIAGRKYVLMVGIIRVSSTFAVGQRSDMVRYDVTWGGLASLWYRDD